MMKTAILLTVFLNLAALANMHGQVINLSVKDIPFKQAILKVQQQSGYVFWYEDKLLQTLPRVSIDLKNGTIQDAMDVLTKDLPLDYSIVEKTVVLKSKLPARKVQSLSNIVGRVLDERGLGLPGVSVMIKGSRKGSVTNEGGYYKISAEPTEVIVFGFIGYISQEVLIGQRNEINIILAPDNSKLNDVLVIGYGNQSKARVTSSISRVKAEDLNRYSGSSFAQQIAGKAAGVVINDASAQPGTDPQIVIRGIGTLTAGRAPLIVVDGFPLSEGSSLNSINPQDIESIDILKDAAAGAIYGARAANGVILITIKKGIANKSKVSLDIYSGFQQRNDKLQFVDAYQAAKYFTEARDNGYISKDPLGRSISDDRATRLSKGASLRELRLNYLQPYLDNQPGLTNTNWADQVFVTAPINSYNFSVSGGSPKTNYYVSANYFNQDGLVINNGLKRYSGSIRIESKLSDKITFSLLMTPSYTKDRYFNNNGSNSGDPGSMLAISYPFFPVYNADGSFAISQQIKANLPEDGALGENPVAWANMITNNKTDFRTFGNTAIIFEPLAGLKFKTLLGGDVRTGFYDFYNPSTIGAYRTQAPKPAVAIETDAASYNYITENTINYSKSFGKHDLDVLGGYTFQTESSNSSIINGSSIPDDNIPNIGGATVFRVTSDRYRWSQISFLGRVQYAFAQKYLLSATLRRDGSSRFGANNKWGNFPSASAGYLISKESFFPKNQVVTFAKLRASWGSSGNNQIGNYSSRALIGTGSSNGGINEYNYNYVFGNTPASGFAATSTANENLTWEIKNAVDIGIDIGLFRKINLSADYYSSTTKNLLLNVPIPAQSGFTSSIQNIGKVNNRGFEVELSGNNLRTGALSFGFNANIATNKNKVLALAPGQLQIIQGGESATNFYTKVGGPIAEIYGYNITGVYKSAEQINSSAHLAGTLTGDYVVEDLDGNGIIDSRDQKAFGTYNPDFTYGFGGTVNYKNLELSVAFNGISGRTIFDQGLSSFQESGEGFAMPSQYYFDNRYDPVANPEGFFASPNLGNVSTARKLTRASSIYYANGSYLRLRNVQLAFDFPEKWTSKIKLSHIRAFATANNLFTWTKYRGYNPDATSNNVLTDGFANYNYPVARSFTFGANIAF